MTLARMILGGQAIVSAGMQTYPADFVVSSDAEWDAVFANSAAALAGRTVEIVGSNFSQRQITNKDIWAAGGRLTIRSADNLATIPSLALNGVVRGIDFARLNFQMTGWPAMAPACFILNNGTFGKIRFLGGTSFRHGYGPAQANFGTASDLPEYERVNNVQIATTASQTFPLTWKSATGPSGWIEFFNRGPNAVRVAVGPSDVVATTSSQMVPAGSRARLTTGISPAASTHFSVLATSGTSEVNARTEIGLSAYLCAAFQQSGAAVLEDIELRNCVFRDLDNGLKGLSPSGSLIAMDCDFDRIYQDIISLAPRPGAVCYLLRNLECLPFARSGIAENLSGDARDPHGDGCQMFENSASGTIGPVYYAGNRVRLTPRRSGTTSQGLFLSDNDFNPSYSNIYVISTMQIGGSGRALSIGEPGTAFKAHDIFIYGATLVDGASPTSNGPFLTVDHSGLGTVYVGKSLAPSFLVSDQPWSNDGNLTGFSPAVFPAIATLPAATTRAAIDAALITTGAGTGIGAVATANAIDWTTTDAEEVIRWDNLPGGAHWGALENQVAGTLITLPLRKILNRRPGQTVSVGAGTEWRKVAADRSTELQAWTASPGTIEPDQYIQIRGFAAADGNLTVTLAVTINGFLQSVPVTTVDLPASYLVEPALAGYFVAPANVPSGTTRLTYRGRFFFPGSVPSAVKPFVQSGTSCDLITQANGSLNASVKDGAGVSLLTNAQVAPVGTIRPDTWHRIVFDVDQTAKEVRLTVDNVTTVTPFAVPGNGLFSTARLVSFLAGSTGLTALPAGTRCADLSVDYNGAVFKTISNVPATANADPWKAGSGIFTGP